MQHITLASHTSLALGHVVLPSFPGSSAWAEPGNEANVALAPQVEFELLEGMQQQNTSGARHQVVCIVFKEVVQINFMA